MDGIGTFMRQGNLSCYKFTVISQKFAVWSVDKRNPMCYITYITKERKLQMHFLPDVWKLK